MARINQPWNSLSEVYASVGMADDPVIGELNATLEKLAELKEQVASDLTTFANEPTAMPMLRSLGYKLSEDAPVVGLLSIPTVKRGGRDTVFTAGVGAVTVSFGPEGKAKEEEATTKPTIAKTKLFKRGPGGKLVEVGNEPEEKPATTAKRQTRKR